MDLMVICQGCLSQDRSLRPLGEFDKLFKAIFRHSFDVFQMGLRTSDLLLCWECLQIIKNIDKFHNQVVEAQLTLSNLMKQRSKNNVIEILSLSRLTTTLIPLDESEQTAEQKLESLKFKCILKVEEEYCKGNVFEFPEISVEKSNQAESHNTPKDDSFDVIVDNLKEESDYEDNYYEQEDVTDIIIESKIEIKEEDKLNMSLQKRKPKPAERKKIVKKTRKSKVLNESTGLSKKQFFYRNLNLLNIIPGSLDENVLEGSKCEENTLKCTKCNEVCYNETDFTSHMKSHFQKYMCKMCGDDLTYDEDHIFRHVMLEHNKYKKKFKCTRKCCLKRFISVEERDKHSSECGIYKCNDCTEVFKSKRELRKHCSKHMTYKCIVCNKKFTNPRAFRYHKYLKHNESEASYCVECDIQFGSIHGMQQHLKISSKHRNDSDVRKRYPCSVCSNFFSSAKTLEHHYNKIHVGITEYHCQPCNKYFFSKYHLRNHNGKHHENKQPLKNKLCSYCGRGFSTNRILKYHIYTHTGERPHECSYCDAKFAQKSARNLHMKKIHKHGINTLVYDEVLQSPKLSNGL